MANNIRRPDGVIEISKKDKRINVSRGIVEIERKGKPIKGVSESIGLVYLLLDCSGSMEGNKLDQAKKGTLDFAKGALAKGYLTGLISFESITKLLCEPTDDLEIIRHNSMALIADGWTNMAKAIEIATDNLMDKAGFKVIFLITDGEPTAPEPNPHKAALLAADRAKGKGIDIICRGTDNADEEFLKKLRTRPDLAGWVPREKLREAIGSAAKMLPGISETDFPVHISSHEPKKMNPSISVKGNKFEIVNIPKETHKIELCINEKVIKSYEKPSSSLSFKLILKKAGTHKVSIRCLDSYQNIISERNLKIAVPSEGRD